MRRTAGLALLIAVTLAGAACQPLAQSPSTGTPSDDGPSATLTYQAVPSGIAIDLAPRVANRPPGGDPSLIAEIPSVRFLPTWTTPLYDKPGGTLIDAGGATTMGNGLALAVLGDSVTVGGATWYRAFTIANDQAGPADYFGWIPGSASAAGSLALGAPTTCPVGDSGIAELAALDPFTRARCLGAATFDLEGSTGWFPLPVWYDVTPAWLGRPQNGTSVTDISIHTGTITSAYVADSPSVDLQLPPGLELPPFGIQVAVQAHVADRDSGSCARSQDANGLEVPVESPADSVLWCATRLVVEQWKPLLGPEGRPIDPRTPQLHRHPSAGGNSICAGVGMSMLTFHVDPSALDPVWLQAAGYSGHILASFDPSFRLRYTPELVVEDGSGKVVARNGTPLDPDGTLDGHFICPEGQMVVID